MARRLESFVVVFVFLSVLSTHGDESDNNITALARITMSISLLITDKLPSSRIFYCKHSAAQMQTAQYAKIDTTDAKVTGYENANSGDCEGVKKRLFAPLILHC